MCLTRRCDEISTTKEPMYAMFLIWDQDHCTVNEVRVKVSVNPNLFTGNFMEAGFLTQVHSAEGCVKRQRFE